MPDEKQHEPAVQVGETPAEPMDDTPPPPGPGGSGAAIEIVVDEKGRVVFTDLPPELQAVLAELNPDDPGSEFCEA